jgi:hypothetical protein
MLAVLTGFVEELRSAGIPVSMVEAIDAARAVEHTDLSDREAFKATLGATLVKNARHYEAFEIAFEVYFGLRAPAAGEELDETRRSGDLARIGSAATAGAGAGSEADASALAAALFRALGDQDDALLQAVVREAVSQLAGIEPGRPVGGTYYLYRTLRRLEVERLLERLLSHARAGTELTPLEERLLREELELRIERFRREVRSEIRRRLVADRGARAVARTLRQPLIEDADLIHAGRAELAEIERVIHPLARKLGSRLAQRRRRGRKGRLDVRRTIRRSLSAGGVPVDPRFRTPRPSKPELWVLADISGSVATFARFTMQLVFAISHQFSRVRSFAFIDTVDEVTGYFGPGVDFGAALQRISTGAEVIWLDGHSDYGNAFRRFWEEYGAELTPRSTVIVTGDARNNYHDANTAAFAQIAAHARALFWINPENAAYWDTGDSVMSSYAPYCDGVYEVRNLRQLAAFVEQLALPTHRPVRRPA